MPMSQASLRRLEPETYLQKAEDDIRRIQLAVSRAEPPWDGAVPVQGWEQGYCGLVQVSEEDVSAEEPGSSGRASSASGATQPTGASPLSRPELPTPPASVASPARPTAGPEQEATESILRQIRGIAASPQEGRQARLQALARQAVDAAARSNPQAALQLLELARAACPAGDSELRQRIARALRQVQQAGASELNGGRQGSAAAGGSAEPQAAAAEPQAPPAESQSAAAAANRHFVAAKDLIKRGQLNQALAALGDAFEACPPDRAEARRQIERHREAVRAALAKQAGR